MNETSDSNSSTTHEIKAKGFKTGLAITRKKLHEDNRSIAESQEERRAEREEKKDFYEALRNNTTTTTTTPEFLGELCRYRGKTIEILSALQHSGGKTTREIADEIEYDPNSLRVYLNEGRKRGIFEKVEGWGWKATDKGLLVLKLKQYNAKNNTTVKVDLESKGKFRQSVKVGLESKGEFRQSVKVGLDSEGEKPAPSRQLDIIGLTRLPSSNS